jgi:hypothetical protein
VIRRPHSRKRNQTVMNREQSTSILRNDAPENARGEGTITETAPASVRRLVALAQEPEKFDALAQPPSQDLGAPDHFAGD